MTLANRLADVDAVGSSLEVILQVKNLVKHYPVRGGAFGKQSAVVHAVDGVSFDLARGETLGLVGESGCGKSTTGRVLMRLYDPTAGEVLFEGVDVARASQKELRAVRRRMQIVFQDPFASLNPKMSAAQNVVEPMRIQGQLNRAGRRARAAELFEQVGLRPDQMDRVPSEFSGGQRQRIGIARALSLEPEVLILDEPVSSLDVSVRAQVLNLLGSLQERLGLAYLFISHDLSVVKHLCDRVAVMYLGKIVEIGSRHQLYSNPLHPYSQALLSAVPIPDPTLGRQGGRIILKGDLPSPVNPPSGCRFRTRCWKAQEICAVEEPKLQIRTADTDQQVACHFPGARLTS